MRIDPTIYAAIDAETLTIDEMCVTMFEVWAEIERTVLAQVAARAVAEGFAKADVALAIEESARKLRATRAARVEAMAQRLETGAVYLQ